MKNSRLFHYHDSEGHQITSSNQEYREYADSVVEEILQLIPEFDFVSFSSLAVTDDQIVHIAVFEQVGFTFETTMILEDRIQKIRELDDDGQPHYEVSVYLGTLTVMIIGFA